MNRVLLFLGLLATVVSMLFLVSCRDTLDLPETETPESNVPRVAKRMTLVYMMAENSLSDYAEKDVDEMCSVSNLVPEDCNLVVFIDDRKLPRICNLYNENGASVCDTVYKFEDDFCSSDTANMRMVFDCVLEMYPTESLNLVMWSHGSGWVDGDIRNVPIQRSIGVDNDRNSYSNTSSKVIEIEELAAFIETLPVRVELLMFDACFMQTVETAYALRNSADWILASPAEIPGDGAPYHRIVEPLFSFPLNVEAVMNGYYEEYKNDEYGVLLSLVKCGAMQELADYTAMYVPHAFSRSDRIEYATLFSYLPDGYFLGSKAYYPDYTDINSAMKAYLSSAEYSVWKAVLDKAVPYAVSSPSWYSAPKRMCYPVDEDDYCGISFYIPRGSANFDVYNRDFANTEWYNAAGWDRAGW